MSPRSHRNVTLLEIPPAERAIDAAGGRGRGKERQGRRWFCFLLTCILSHKTITLLYSTKPLLLPLSSCLTLPMGALHIFLTEGLHRAFALGSFMA